MPAGTDLCQVEMAIHITARVRMHVYQAVTVHLYYIYYTSHGSENTHHMHF